MLGDVEFIGREQELTDLSNALDQSKIGHGSILFVTGEAGVGKTRLVEELLKQNSQQKFDYLRGECIYHEGTDPYLPFIDMFKDYLVEHPYLAKALEASFYAPAGVIFDHFPLEKQRYAPIKKATDEAIIRKDKSSKVTPIDTVSRDIGTDISTSSNYPTGSESICNYTPTEFYEQQLLQGRHRMFETISKIILNISKKKPLILFLDDVHWADSASLHLLHYLARTIKDYPILIICAYRLEELNISRGSAEPLQELISRLGTENLFSLIELKRLNKVQTNKIVKDQLEVLTVPTDLSELIFRETEGNPFFIKEILKTLIGDGSLVIENGTITHNISPDEIIIPVSIKELINFQTHRLDDDWLEVLEYASVIGYEFDLDLINSIMDISESKLINILSKLTEAKFIIDIKKEDSFSWQFTHNKVHEVIYTGVNNVKKKVIHLKIAKYLEDSNIEQLDQIIYDLANHFYHGIDFDRALSYSIEGGEKAMLSYANKEAMDLYNISLNSIRRLDEKLANTPHYKEKKIEILSKLGTLNKTVGEWDKALTYYEQIIPICDEIGDWQEKSSTYLDIGWIYQQRCFWTEAQKYFNRSLELAKEMKDKFLAAEAYNGLGAVFERKGNFESALENYSISLKFAENNHDLVNLAKAHNAFGRVYNQQGNFSKAVKHKEKAIQIFEKLNDLPELAKAYTSLGLSYYDMGDMEKNIEYNDKCILLADRISDIRIKGYGLSNTVDGLIKSNQLDKALDYTSEALEIFKKIEERYMIALNYVNYGIIFKEKREWNKAVYYIKMAIELLENLNIPYHIAECYRQFADIYERKGEGAKASYYERKAKEVSAEPTSEAMYF